MGVACESDKAVPNRMRDDFGHHEFFHDTFHAYSP